MYKWTARLDSPNKSPCPRGHEAEDLIWVWGMYIFGNGLVSCMCECVSLSVCHCLPVWLSACLCVCLCVCVNVHNDAHEWVGVSGAPLWQCRLLLIQLGRESCNCQNCNRVQKTTTNFTACLYSAQTLSEAELAFDVKIFISLNTIMLNVNRIEIVLYDENGKSQHYISLHPIS